jgi:hypothetical protein
MEEDRMPKKIFTQEMEGTIRRGRPRKGWREEAERDLQVLEVRKWRELVIGKNGEVLFDRPKPTAGCSANGRRRSIHGKLLLVSVLSKINPLDSFLPTFRNIYFDIILRFTLRYSM